MKTAAALKQDILAELDWDPAIEADSIGVAVSEGVVALTGHVASYAQKWAVQKAVRRVAGVKAIALDLEVCIAPDHRRDDTDIAAAATACLNWQAKLPPGAVSVTVDKGWLTLEGEVALACQRQGAERALRSLKGVVGIDNAITVKKRVQPADIAERIRAALARRTDREARHVSVVVDQGVVTLRGSVHSWQERDAAVGAALSTTGVGEVINELTIA